MGILQSVEIFCQAPSAFYLGNSYRLHLVLSGENEIARR